MKIVSFRAFDGRNIYSHRKCIRMDVDMEGYGDTPSRKISNFNSKLVGLIPELRMHRCGIDEDGGFIKRLNEGTYLPHICEHIILALQNRIGIDVCYGKARQISGDLYYIIYEYREKRTGIKVGELAVKLINHLISNSECDLEFEVDKLKMIYSKERLGPSTYAIIEEAKKRGIPSIRIGDGSLVQLGYGKCGKIIEATIADKTCCTAVDIACDKLLTKKLLRFNCIPVAEGYEVTNSLELLKRAEEIGYPVVIKPRYGNQGNGVVVNIQDEKELMNAYKKVRQEYKNIIIEKYIKGKDYRVLFVDNKLIACAQRIPPEITGDGIKSINQLIEEVNLDSKRGNGHENILSKIKVDDELKHCIHQRGYKLESIPKKGTKIVLRENGNLSTGGISIDCTDEISDENTYILKRACKAIGLDICGIDICCEDISKSLKENGAVIEINAAPGIRMHQYPYKGKSRNAAGAIVDYMFKDTHKNIPVISVTGTNGKTTTTRLIGYVLSLLGMNVGMTTTGGIYINERCIEKGDTTGPNSAMAILLNKEVDAAVLETARGGIVKRGLAYDLADIGIITNITEDHLGIDGINTMNELADVKSLVAEAVKDNGYVVINADDKMSLSIINRIKSNIIFFSMNKNNKFVRKNIEDGGIGIYVHDGCIYAEKGSETLNLIKISDIGISFHGKLEYNIQNAMAAVSALVGMGIKYSTIRKGLRQFKDDDSFNPGRFNMFNVEGTTLVLDYGHNIEGYKAVLKSADKIKHRRLVGVIGVPGDRMDKNIIRIGKIAGEKFDYIYIKEDKDRRGRKPFETAELLKKGVISAGFDESKIKVILSEEEAFKRAIDDSKNGDLIITFFEDYEPLHNIVMQKIKNEKLNLQSKMMA